MFAPKLASGVEGVRWCENASGYIHPVQLNTRTYRRATCDLSARHHYRRPRYPVLFMREIAQIHWRIPKLASLRT